ncbi:MAG: hypothetical protein ACXVA4_08930, partial [Ktedonobacterales bacterium]
LSLTSFHGRGFFPGFLSLGDWVARLGALEAVSGLFIEVVPIATFVSDFEERSISGRHEKTQATNGFVPGWGIRRWLLGQDSNL